MKLLIKHEYLMYDLGLVLIKVGIPTLDHFIVPLKTFVLFLEGKKVLENVFEVTSL